MSLKQALANSLLMFVAATCVVLIVKALPERPRAGSTAAAAAGGPSLPVAGGQPTPALRDGVQVLYLHGNTRCPTCRQIEAYAHEAVQAAFAEELSSGKIRWQVVNYESPGNEHYARDYEVVAPTVVFTRFSNGRQAAWKGLPEVWEHVGDKAAFFEFVQGSLREFMGGAPANAAAAPDPAPAAAAPPEPPLPVP